MIRHIKKILLCLLLLLGCNFDQERKIRPSQIRKASISHPSGESISLDIFHTNLQISQGLSGKRSTEFPENKGALFYFKEDGMRNFWMPDTYFNLDIIFLDSDFKIIHIARNVQAHPGYNEPPQITRLDPIWCRHVLEIKATSKFSQVIKNGDRLDFKYQ